MHCLIGRLFLFVSGVCDYQSVKCDCVNKAQRHPGSAKNGYFIKHLTGFNDSNR